jgi:hypothetical protein
MKKNDIIASIAELYNSAVNAWNAISEEICYNFDHPINMVRASNDIRYGLKKDFSYTVLFDGKFKRLERYTIGNLMELENYLDWLIHFYAISEI